MTFLMCCVVFFKQKTAYEMRISDWSSDVCSSDLFGGRLKKKKKIVQGRPTRPPSAAGWAIRGVVCRGRVSLLISAGCQISWREIGRASCRERVCQAV